MVLMYKKINIHKLFFFFFFQAEDGIRDAQESRGLGDVYKRQVSTQSTGIQGGTMHWSSLVLLVLTLSLAHADEQTISLDSLSRYTVNPAAPCGTLCQIKRAMAAWGDVMPAVKVPSLVSKYSRMRMDRKAVKALRVQSTKLQQRLGAVHRALSEVEGNRLDPDLEALRRLDAKASKLVGQVRIRGSKADTRAALEAAKLIDAEQAALTKFEIAVDDQRAIHTLKDQNKHLSTQLERLSGKLNQDPSSSSERNLGIQIKQLLQHSGEIEHKLTTQHSKLQHSSRLELEARIKRLARGYAHCVTQSEAVGELSKLEHEVSLVTQRKAAIDSGFDPNQAVGKVAVLHEVIAKAQHAIYQEMKGFLPTKSAKDQQRLTKIKNLVRHEQRNIERYQRLRDKLKQSSDISHTLALLERRSQRDLGDPMAEMRNSLKTLKRREPAKPSPQQSGPQAPAQLASEIDKLLEQTEAQREHRIQHTEAERTKSSSMQAGIAEMHRGLDKLGADSGVMKTKMAELKHESNGAGQEAGDDDVDLGAVSYTHLTLPTKRIV
eukprot:TRINITY_DN606_c0_g1_i3.p1 TRINITY_DN606_c0_g1~~TRINITY_DN606_c0_g1_i3.p1  ORF type:complete len:548 (-),score=169.65 TRINITY_DN606_c0_g1_i3:138-1781(-)